MARFVVDIPKADGGIEVHRMKERLRQRPASIPSGLDATNSTSHQLRDGPRRLGWTVHATMDDVRHAPEFGDQRDGIG